jgi:hypothetical protein
MGNGTVMKTYENKINKMISMKRNILGNSVNKIAMT